MRRKQGVAFIALGVGALFFSAYWMLFEVGVSLENALMQYSYFTNQVTVISGIYLILLGTYYCGARKLRGFVLNPAIKTAIAAYVAIVGVGYYIGVVPFSMVTTEDLYILAPQSIYMHAIHPAIVLFLYGKTPFNGLKRSSALLPTLAATMAYPVCYLFFAEIRAAISSFYVYPFLNPQVMGSVENVLWMSLAVLMLGCLVVLLFQHHGRKRAIAQPV